MGFSRKEVSLKGSLKRSIRVTITGGMGPGKSGREYNWAYASNLYL